MDLKVELLDPERWSEVLAQCANAMQVAVALTDQDGVMTGICHNPQPIWTLARNAKPEWGNACPFCLDTKGLCRAAKDAREQNTLILVRDPIGFAHVAIPLVLDEHYYGTLLAGQVLARYPDPVALEELAQSFGLSPHGIWNKAKQQMPVSASNLAMFGKLLMTLSQALLGQRFGMILKRRLALSNVDLKAADQELELVNLTLKAKVEELSVSNLEKSVLLQEVHHRVNNNLQVIASLLRLQADSFGDVKLADALRTSQQRVESMALIHAQLYDAHDLSQVDFADYSSRLAENLLMSYGVDRSRITLSVSMEGLELTVDQAIPAGLILSELISNAIKYAFPEQRHGSLHVGGKRTGNQIELSIQDDGVGIPETTEPRARKSLGLQIVKILCRQLHGKLQQTGGGSEPGPGTIFRLSFPAEAAKHGTA